jgi:MFS family permease
MVYPTLLAAIGDVAHPSWRASSVGVYRLWRDSGFAIGAILAGAIADWLGLAAAIWAVAALTAASGLVVAVRMYETHPTVPTPPRSPDRLATPGGGSRTDGAGAAQGRRAVNSVRRRMPSSVARSEARRSRWRSSTTAWPQMASISARWASHWSIQARVTLANSAL